MERRQEPRFPVQLPVHYTIVGASSPRLSGQLRDVSEGGSRLHTETALLPGTFVKLEFDDAVLFGEVRYCCPWLKEFVSGLLIERVLLGESELSRLIAVTLPDIPRAVHLPVP